MKTIIHVHIFIRMVGLILMAFGLYRIAAVTAALKKFKDAQEKQKALMGQEFHLADLFPTFTEMLFGPVVLVAIGLCLFLLVKKFVRLIIGSEQIETLLKIDQINSRGSAR